MLVPFIRFSLFGSGHNNFTAGTRLDSTLLCVQCIVVLTDRVLKANQTTKGRINRLICLSIVLINVYWKRGRNEFQIVSIDYHNFH